MVSNHGYVKYFVMAKIKKPHSSNIEMKKSIKEIMVHAPFDKDLLVMDLFHYYYFFIITFCFNQTKIFNFTFMYSVQ